MFVRFARLWVSICLVLGLAFAFGMSACDASSFDDDGSRSGSSGDTSASGEPTGSGGSGGCLFDCTGPGVGGGAQGAIVITPADIQLDVVGGNVPTQAFTATLNQIDVTDQVTWVYDRPEIGDMGPGAVFTPTGNVGGLGTLTATLGDAKGSTTVAVHVTKVVNTGNLTPDQITALDSPNGPADPSMVIVYPYDGTVFPLAVLAPEIQWNGAQNGDVYKLRFVEKYMEYTEYFSTNLPARHIPPQADWDAIESSGAGANTDPLQVSLTRMSGMVAYQPVTQTWHIAQGRLHGSVYYWELPDACGNGNGRVLRISPGSTATDQFYPTAECFGCHTVSRDGKTMLATFDTGLPFPIQKLDLTQNPAVLGNMGGVAGTFSAFNDKGDKFVKSNDAASNPSGVSLQIHDALTGQVLNPNAMGTGCGEPAWSPDGKKMAAICGLGGFGWVFDASSGYLAVADVAPDGVTVTNVQQIVPQAGGQGRPAYPSFSPGSEWIAFGRPTQGSRSIGNGDLWLVAPDGSNLKQLLTASSDNKSFNPVFAPLRAGGFFWIVFITRRDYGNTLVGANRQQLWITAIDDPPSAPDPSHPPFYLRGQENCGKSENAYYALDPCKELGEACTSGVDCCNGQCIKDPNTGMYVCGEPGECSQNGNACVTSADCCDTTAECIDGFCTPPIPR